MDSSTFPEHYKDLPCVNIIDYANGVSANHFRVLLFALNTLLYFFPLYYCKFFGSSGTYEASITGYDLCDTHHLVSKLLQPWKIVHFAVQLLALSPLINAIVGIFLIRFSKKPRPKTVLTLSLIGACSLITMQWWSNFGYYLDNFDVASMPVLLPTSEVSIMILSFTIIAVINIRELVQQKKFARKASLYER